MNIVSCSTIMLFPSNKYNLIVLNKLTTLYVGKWHVPTFPNLSKIFNQIMLTAIYYQNVFVLCSGLILILPQAISEFKSKYFTTCIMSIVYYYIAKYIYLNFFVFIIYTQKNLMLFILYRQQLLIVKTRIYQKD